MHTKTAHCLPASPHWGKIIDCLAPDRQDADTKYTQNRNHVSIPSAVRTTPDEYKYEYE